MDELAYREKRSTRAPKLKWSHFSVVLLTLSLLFYCRMGDTQQKVVPLREAHHLALKEPGAKEPPDTGPFSGMTHTEWGRSDGAPGSISSLAQTTDGYLWIGSALGLYRFDGIHFAKYPFGGQQAPLPTGDVQSVAADPYGGLWIGLRIAAVVHLGSDGTATVYGRASGLTPETLDRVVVRRDGSLFVRAGGHLLTLENEHWIDFGRSHGLGSGAVFSLFFDGDDTMWVAQDHRIMKLQKGSKDFRLVPSSVFYVSSFARTSEGRLWMADSWRKVRRVDESAVRTIVRLEGTAQLLADSQGSLWIAEDFFGLTRVRDLASRGQSNTMIEHESSRPWLTSPQIGDLLEDRDGNIWVGTALGLDRYQRTSFEQFRAATLNSYPSVIGAQDGSVWINSHGEPLMRWYEGKLTTFGQFVTYGPLASRRNGEVCFVDARANDLQCYGSQHATHVILDKRIEYAPAQAMVEDLDGSLLVSFENKGIWRFDGSWDRLSSPGLPLASPQSMLLDSSGRLWLGFQGKQIAFRSGDHFQSLSMPGDRWDNTLVLYEGKGKVWAAGSSGLGFFNGQQMQRVHGDSAEMFTGTSGLAFDLMGDLWLNSGAGVLRVSSNSVAHLLNSPDQLVHVDVYDERDGLTGKPTQNRPTPSLICDAHGTLWFATAGHLTRLDPKSIAKNTYHFDVLIESLLLDGTQLLPHGGNAQIFRTRPFDHHSLEVNYAAVNLSEPERMTYRYRLVGEDASWQYAGSRRQAFYNRLRPGRYSFELSARQEEGAWIDLKMPIQIDVPATFYQTIWFTMFLALSLGMLVLAAVRLRIRALGADIRRREEVRADERIRIARDLHDTLLQGVLGLTLRFNAVANQLPEGSQTRDILDSALIAADRLIEEGRNQVNRLRANHLTVEQLVSGLKTIAADLNYEKRVSFFVEFGQSQADLNPSVLGELSYIGQEAITNSFRHSHASVLLVKLEYLTDVVRFTVSDNGRGFDVAAHWQGAPEGHWGLYGMRERAEAIRARFVCLSKVDLGTEVIVTLPARVAYRKY